MDEGKTIMQINRNMSAVVANNQLLGIEERLSASIERLSSGLKINRASDNPSGMAISNKMKAQIDALDQAEANAADGISVVQIADGALNEVSSILQRIRELSVQAANGVNSFNDRQSMQDEVSELVKEVDRISSDTDILINQKDEKKLSAFLKSKGYDVKKRDKNDHHMKATHPIGGLLEVHVALNDELFDRLAFNDKVNYDEPYETITLGKNTIHTLGINDNLMYLTAHYIRHFLNGGSSIRQMMDLLLYMKKYEDKIDFDKYNKLLKELKYDKLIDAVQSIGAKYFGMDFEVNSQDIIDVLLEDCEKCGLFGSCSEHSTNVNNAFYQKRNVVSPFKLKFLYYFKSEHTIFKRIFPSQKTLLKMGYKYAKNKIFIPFAWIHKLFDFCLKRNKVRNEILNTDVHNERIETMRKLSIID